MVLSHRAAVIGSVVLLSLSGPAFGWGHHRRGTVSSYYYGAPAGYYYVPAAAPVVYPQYAPVTAVPATPAVSTPVYAVPSPAPAISTPAPSAPPPATMPPAGVTESRSSYPAARSSYYRAPTTAATAGLVPVAFWNRSGQDLWVQIAGQWRLLGQNRGLTLDLPRGFTWQVQGRTAQQEQVPEDRGSMRIVIRP